MASPQTVAADRAEDRPLRSDPQPSGPPQRTPPSGGAAASGSGGAGSE